MQRFTLPLVLLVRLRRASLSVLLLLVLLGLVVRGLDFLHLPRVPVLLLLIMVLVLVLLLLIMLLLLLLLMVLLLRLHLVLLGLGKARGVLGLHGSGVGLLALGGHLGLPAVLRVDGGLGSENFHGPIVAAASDQVLALVAAVLGILEPVREAGHAGQADADETEESADEAVAKTLAVQILTHFFEWHKRECIHLHGASLLANLGHGSAVAEGAVDGLRLVAEHVERHHGRGDAIWSWDGHAVRSSLCLVVARRQSLMRLALGSRQDGVGAVDRTVDRTVNGRRVEVGRLDRRRRLLRMLLLLAHCAGFLSLFSSVENEWLGSRESQIEWKLKGNSGGKQKSRTNLQVGFAVLF